MVCMKAEQESSQITVSVFTRHAANCGHKDDPQFRRCKCRKHLYIYQDGKVRYTTARTRSWEKAEALAVEERSLYDPAEILKRKLEAQVKVAEGRKPGSEITVEAALDLWLGGQKDQSASTAKTYRNIKRKISSWAATQGVTLLREVTAAQLDTWRSDWSLKATRVEDRMGLRTQGQFQMHLKAFFRWAYEMEYIPRDPAKGLKSIKCQDQVTIPLTNQQFEELMEAISHYDGDRRRDEDRFGVELKALCLVMRWTGLRITDVLMLPRMALVGNRLTLKTQKTRAYTTPVLPDHVVDALRAIPPRPGVHPDYFFWSLKSSPHSLGNRWADRIRFLNARLNFTDEHGKPMQFHSHMLRDTFAVEMLLAGVPLEDVSRMLTHSSIRTTEKHYAPWVKARRRQLEDKAVAAMRKMGATFSVAQD